MQVASFVSVNPEMGQTRTYERFNKWIGAHPHAFGLISRMYDDCTASFLTESLQNIFYNDSKTGNKFQSVDAMYYEWEVSTEHIKRIEFADVPTTTGENGTEIVMAFKERYYEKFDIFRIDKSEQQCQVVARPVRKRDDYWEVTVRLIDNDYSSVLDLSACQVGDTTMFISNAMPELHEEGYVKYQSNVSKMRNYITTHRCDDSYSALYAAMEDKFIKIASGKGNGEMKEVIYKLDAVEANLLKNFMYVRNTGLLLNKCNVDKNGKPTIVDPDTNRPIYIGDGMIPQVERFASKYAYSRLSFEVFRAVLTMMGEKAEKPTGNNYVFICNESFWSQVQKELYSFLADFHTDGAFMWSKAKNGYVSVGATFDSYEFGGNKISFKVDRALTREYGAKGFAICLDLTANQDSSMPPIALFSLKGKDYITNQILGVGGKDGLSSGVVSSPVAGSKLVAWGTASIAVFNPYRSFILREI